MTTLLLIGRALLLAASFAGLCASLRVRFGLDRFVAPLAACSGIMLLLSLLGSLNLLAPGAYALYALGFAGLFYAYGLRRGRPQWALILAMLLFMAFLAWHFYPVKLRHNDDFSHWGTIARFMLIRDRLPVGADGLITHQSYPPGAACFLYYAAKPLEHTDGVYLAAQSFLIGALLLPVFSLVRRRALYPVAAALVFTFLCYSLRDRNLLVDELQVALGTGAAAAIILYRDDLRRALGVGLAASAAVALVKSGGLYFSLFTALMLVYPARRRGLPRAKRRLLLLAAIGAPALAYLLWLARVHLCFPAMETSAHAVSLTAFSQNMRAKGLAGAAKVASAMLGALLRPANWRLINTAVLLLAAILLLAVARRLPAQERGRVRSALLFAAAALGVWLIMLFCTYIFSMSENDAETITSFYRYFTVGVEYASALCAVSLLLVLQREDARFPAPLLRAAGALSMLGLAGVLALMIWPGVQCPIDGFFARETQYADFRGRIAPLREAQELPYGGRYLVYLQYDQARQTRKIGYLRVTLGYEFGNSNPCIIATDHSAPERTRIGTPGEAADADAILRYLADNIDGCDAFIIGDAPTPELEALFDAFLDAYAGDTPVYRAYA